MISYGDAFWAGAAVGSMFTLVLVGVLMFVQSSLKGSKS